MIKIKSIIQKISLKNNINLEADFLFDTLVLLKADR